MKTVAVVDYGMGNLRSVAQAVMHVAQGSGFEVVVTAHPQDVRAADRVVLPGQGAMPDCMRELRDSGLREPVLEAAAGKPLFGVCVGMQMLLDRSHEGPTDGLGLIHGEVVKFELEGRLQPDGSRYKVPQMGWNQVWQTRAASALAGRAGRQLLLFRAQLLRAAVGCAPQRRGSRLRRAALPPRLHAIIFLRPSSTQKKAQTKAWLSTETSSNGILDPRTRRANGLPCYRPSPCSSFPRLT